MAVPMANDPPFATLNHFAADLGIPSESDLLRIGIRDCVSPEDQTKVEPHSKNASTLGMR
jgi:hypothetical protein